MRTRGQHLHALDVLEVNSLHHLQALAAQFGGRGRSCEKQRLCEQGCAGRAPPPQWRPVRGWLARGLTCCAPAGGHQEQQQQQQCGPQEPGSAGCGGERGVGHGARWLRVSERVSCGWCGLVGCVSPGEGIRSFMPDGWGGEHRSWVLGNSRSFWCFPISRRKTQEGGARNGAALLSLPLIPRGVNVHREGPVTRSTDSLGSCSLHWRNCLGGHMGDPLFHLLWSVNCSLLEYLF